MEPNDSAWDPTLAILPLEVLALAQLVDLSSATPLLTVLLYPPTSPRYVLVIEKEATFRRLVDEKLPQRTGPCILVTG